MEWGENPHLKLHDTECTKENAQNKKEIERFGIQGKRNRLPKANDQIDLGHTG